jgi:hypothetical protein
MTGDMANRKAISILFSAFYSLLSAVQCSRKNPEISEILICAHPEGPVCQKNSDPNSKSEVIHLTARLGNIPKPDKLSIKWEYTENSEPALIDEVSVALPQGDSLISSSITIPAKEWPKGSYKITLKSEISGISRNIGYTL